MARMRNAMSSLSSQSRQVNGREEWPGATLKKEDQLKAMHERFICMCVRTRGGRGGVTAVGEGASYSGPFPLCLTLDAVRPSFPLLLLSTSLYPSGNMQASSFLLYPTPPCLPSHSPPPSPASLPFLCLPLLLPPSTTFSTAAAVE